MDFSPWFRDQHQHTDHQITSGNSYSYCVNEIPPDFLSDPMRRDIIEASQRAEARLNEDGDVNGAYTELLGLLSTEN